jgi:hypothetical protein
VTVPLSAADSDSRYDVSLGRFGLEGKRALSVIPGQQIELTGVTMTVRDKEVFVVRSANANGKTYIMRNEHWIDVLQPMAR